MKKRHVPSWHKSEKLTCRDCIYFSKRCHKGYPLQYGCNCPGYEKREEPQILITKIGVKKFDKLGGRLIEKFR